MVAVSLKKTIVGLRTDDRVQNHGDAHRVRPIGSSPIEGVGLSWASPPSAVQIAVADSQNHAVGAKLALAIQPTQKDDSDDDDDSDDNDSDDDDSSEKEEEKKPAVKKDDSDDDDSDDDDDSNEMMTANHGDGHAYFTGDAEVCVAKHNETKKCRWQGWPIAVPMDIGWCDTGCGVIQGRECCAAACCLRRNDSTAAGTMPLDPTDNIESIMAGAISDPSTPPGDERPSLLKIFDILLVASALVVIAVATVGASRKRKASGGASFSLSSLGPRSKLRRPNDSYHLNPVDETRRGGVAGGDGGGGGGGGGGNGEENQELTWDQIQELPALSPVDRHFLSEAHLLKQYAFNSTDFQSYLAYDDDDDDAVTDVAGDTGSDSELVDHSSDGYGSDSGTTTSVSDGYSSDDLDAICQPFDEEMRFGTYATVFSTSRYPCAPTAAAVPTARAWPLSPLAENNALAEVKIESAPWTAEDSSLKACSFDGCGSHGLRSDSLTFKTLAFSLC
eukprot:SAG11_NODE_2789_length_2971_cov_1.344359_2_plen_503_part_00